MGYLYLVCAIIAEVTATSALKSSQGFSKLIPSVIVVVGYSVSFYFLSVVLKTIPIGVAYAIWSGIGIALISVIGFVAFKQTLDLPAILGIGFIIVGVAIMNLFSNSLPH